MAKNNDSASGPSVALVQPGNIITAARGAVAWAVPIIDGPILPGVFRVCPSRPAGMSRARCDLTLDTDFSRKFGPRAGTFMVQLRAHGKLSDLRAEGIVQGMAADCWRRLGWMEGFWRRVARWLENVGTVIELHGVLVFARRLGWRLTV